MTKKPHDVGMPKKAIVTYPNMSSLGIFRDEIATVPRKPRETQGDLGKPRETQGDLGKPRETQGFLGKPQ